MGDNNDALLWRGTRSDAQLEADKLKPSARRRGYDVVVRGTLRRHGNYTYEERPYGVFLEPRDP
jgi:hypothetical protein